MGKPWRDYCQLVEGRFFGVLGAASGGRVGVPKIRQAKVAPKEAARKTVQ